MHCSQRMAVIFLFLLATQTVISQTILTGTITDTTGKAIEGASVLLLKQADSSLIKGTLSNGKGIFQFKLSQGKYLVSVTHAGFRQVFSNSFESGKNDVEKMLPAILLTAQNMQLESVTVTAIKPFLEQKIDRLVVNVAEAITSPGNSVLEVLERSPGVIIDRQNNSISMNGKNGVVVMINGKISRMPASAIVQLLSGMSSGNVEKIELITTPPANFDAEGNAGYINIVLKENDNLGTNGSFGITIGYSKGIISENNFNINHRKGKLNVYGDISYSIVQSPFTVRGTNRYGNNGIIIQTDLKANRTNRIANINGRAGADFQMNKRTIIGVLLTGYDNYFSQHEQNENRKYRNGLLDTIMKLSNSEINHWKSLSGNINLQHNYKGENKISANFDYIRYSNHQPVNYFTDLFDGTDKFIYNQQYKSEKNTPINFWVGSLDINHRISKLVSMEAGLKRTISQFDNSILFERKIGGQFKKDSGLTATYLLRENYSAAYASFEINPGKKTTAKLGLRYEYTNSNLGSLERKNIVDRHYGRLFPTFFLSHTLDEKNRLNLSFTRRITRPTFNDLAPFTYYADPNTVLTGNPALQPSFSNSIKVDYGYSTYLLSLSCSHEANAITGFQPGTDSVSGKTILSAQNLKNLKTVSLILSIPITINAWWKMQYNFTGLWQQVNALYQQESVRLNKTNFQINGNMSFVLPKSFTAELSGFYQSRGLSGIAVTRPLGSLDAGIKKTLPEKKGALAFTVGNIFNSVRYGGVADIPEKNLYSSFNLQFSQRSYKLTYTRNFGKDKLRQKRQRATGAEDEKNRVQ